MERGRVRQAVGVAICIVIIALAFTTGSVIPSKAGSGFVDPSSAAPAARPTPNLLEQPYLKINEQATDLALPDLNGNIVWLSDLRGKVVILSFWATWCAPCRQELPELATAYEALQAQGVEILAVNVGESDVQVRAFNQEIGMPFPVLLDAKGFAAYAYGVRAIPTSFIIDRSGVLRYSQMGGLTVDTIQQVLKDLD